MTPVLFAAFPSNGPIIGRMAVATLLGMVVGWEREIRNRGAGMRTFGLMTLGAALFAVTGLYSDVQVGRVIAGIATGVGFIGAGVVWRSQESENIVHGLTTAAGMWAMAAVGVIAGLGRPAVAAAVTGLVVLLFEQPYLPVFKQLDARRVQHRFRRDTDLPDAPIQDEDRDDGPGLG